MLLGGVVRACVWAGERELLFIVVSVKSIGTVRVIKVRTPRSRSRLHPWHCFLNNAPSGEDIDRGDNVSTKQADSAWIDYNTLCRRRALHASCWYPRYKSVPFYSLD